MVTVVPFALVVLAFVAAIAELLIRRRGFGPERIARVLLRWIFVFPLALMGLWAFSGHVFAPAQVAASIGWATSPFQFEIGMANLSLGVTGLIAAFRRDLGFPLAVAIAALCFLGGDGVGHIIQIEKTGDMASGNAGIILYMDLFVPLALLALIGVITVTRKSGGA